MKYEPSDHNFGLQMIQFHSFLIMKYCKIETFRGDFLDYFSDFFFVFHARLNFAVLPGNQ